MTKKGDVLIFIEQEEFEIHKVSYELLGKGRHLAYELDVELDSILLGYNMEEQSVELFKYGSDKVYLYNHKSFQNFDVIQYSRNIVKHVKETKPEIFLLGATQIGKTLAPRIAAALRTGLTADCIDLKLDNYGNLIQIRPAFSGNILAQVKTKTIPQIATVRYGVMKKNEKKTNRKGILLRKKPEIIADTGIRLLEKINSNEINIAESKVIVSGGRGLKRPKDFLLLKQLAEILGGEVGSSRPLVDDGWISKDHQIGFSGNTVKPRIYIACGISGAPQHLYGMRDSDTIIAINKDPSAPIFNIADYCLIGDLYEILPLLILELEKKFGRKRNL
jgi:electron transfer flavoprotein alpha subunit